MGETVVSLADRAAKQFNELIGYHKGYSVEERDMKLYEGLADLASAIGSLGEQNDEILRLLRK